MILAIQMNVAQMAFSPYLIFPYRLVPLTVLTWCHVDGNMHGNDMQLRLCILN